MGNNYFYNKIINERIINMNNNWKVYKHTNLINGKSYIGITSKTLKERCGANGKQYGEYGEFPKDIQKYGWVKGFTHDILKDNLTEREAKELEHMYINEYNTLEPNGYNSQRGTRKVKNIKTGEIFYSIKEASRSQYLNESERIAYARIRNSCEKQVREWRWV